MQKLKHLISQQDGLLLQEIVQGLQQATIFSEIELLEKLKVKKGSVESFDCEDRKRGRRIVDVLFRILLAPGSIRCHRTTRKRG